MFSVNIKQDKFEPSLFCRQWVNIDLSQQNVSKVFFFCFRCNDPKKVSLAAATMNSVEKLTADLQDTARLVCEMASRENRTLEQSLAFMGVVERMNLLQREWATKVRFNLVYKRVSLQGRSVASVA